MTLHGAMRVLMEDEAAAIRRQHAMNLVARRTTMSYEEAQAIVSIYERARKSIAAHGVTPSDWIAKDYGVGRGEGLSLLTQAQAAVRLGPTCPHCGGSGHLRPEG